MLETLLNVTAVALFSGLTVHFGMRQKYGQMVMSVILCLLFVGVYVYRMQMAV